MSLTQGNFSKKRSARTNKYSHNPPKTLINTNMKTPLTKTSFYKGRDSKIQMSYERDTLSRNHLKLDIDTSKFRNRQSINRSGLAHNSKIHLNSRAHNYVRDKYMRNGPSHVDRFSKTSTNLHARTPVQNNRYNAYSGKYSQSKSHLKNYLNSKNSSLKSSKYDYINSSRLNTSSSRVYKQSDHSARYDSDQNLIESKFIQGTQVYDTSHKKDPSPFNENSEIKRAMEKSNQLF